jgi:RNA polymerase sigma-70 factor (ECF subfamily)
LHCPEESTLERTHALDRFLAGVERRALRIAEFATGDREDALDLVQDAMMKLVSRYRGRSEQEWAPLFYRILQSRINDWHRRSRVRNRFRVWLGGARAADEDEGAADPIQAAVDAGQPDCITRLQHTDAMAVLQDALRSLPLRQQQAFLLRSWEGLDVAGTALAMGCSEGSVKTHYSRAVHTLRDRLGEHWP